VHNVVSVQVVDSPEDLFNGLRGVLLCELSLFANPVEQFTSRGKLRHDIILVLQAQSCQRLMMTAFSSAPTLDSNQSTNLTMCGCLSRCKRSSSSSTICSFPLTFFFRMILTATLPSGPSASLTMP